MPRLELHLLGPPRVELDGEPVHIGRRKALALLAYLAMTPGSHRRDTLATLLWPDYDQQSARAHLRRALVSLTNRLGGERFVADRESIGLNPASRLSLDVDQFRQRLATCQAHGHAVGEACPECVPLLEEAVGLYRDGFLAGFTLTDSLAFDEWQLFQAQALRGELASALERLVRAHVAQGTYEAAIPYARRWVALDPTNELAHRQLMELLARVGERSAALQQYQFCRQTLAQELGVRPSDATRALYERLRSGESLEPEPEAPAAIPHKLPPQPTPFVGREAELAELDRLVADPNVRLITILGPGGVGKTRLALAAAEEQLQTTVTVDGEMAPRFPNGVFFVALAALSSADQIVPTAAKALGFSFYERREPRQQLLDYLREKRLLLILDGFDPLLSDTQVASAVELLTDLLHTAPRLEILVTSRERLHLRQEQVYSIEGLAFPDWDTPDATAYAAVELFVQSARRVQSDFDLAADDLPHLVRLCRLVEGMPLGIELAAAWVNMLSLADIADETQRSLDFLETDWRDVLARQRSIRAVFETSWHRLGEAERDAFRRLSVFRGAFTRPAAQDIAGASLRVLVALADKSLLQFDRASDRYQIHELLRQYGAEVLRADPVLEADVLDRHSAHYCGWLGQREAELQGARQQTALAEIEADIGNVQAAWNWAVERVQVERLDQAIDGLCRFYLWRRRYQEGEAACRLAAGRLSALAPADGPVLSPVEGLRVLAKILTWQSVFSEPTEAGQLLQQCLALLQRPELTDQDTRPEKAFALQQMGDRAIDSDCEEARQLYERSLALYRALGDGWGTANALAALGWVGAHLGASREAKQRGEESLALRQALGDQRGIADSFWLLGTTALRQGQIEEAMRLIPESLAIRRKMGDLIGVANIAHSLDLGMTLTWIGEFAEAHSVREETLAIYQHQGLRDKTAMAHVRLATSKLHLGQYEGGRTHAQIGLALCREIGDQRGIGISLFLLGGLAVFGEAYGEAQTLLQESIAHLQTVEGEEMGWALALLGSAARGQGQISQARRHCCQALRTGTGILSIPTVAMALPGIALLLVDQGELEWAVELHALASCYPLFNSQIFQDLWWKHIAVLAAALPPEAVAAAQARGRARDLEATVAELLVELGG